MSEKLNYRVREGRRFGSFFEHGPGSIVQLTEEQAAGFPDILVLDVEPSEPSADSEADYLATLTVKQLTNFPEFEKLPAPKPTAKADIIAGILSVRHSSDVQVDFNNDLVLESMTVAELQALPEWNAVDDPKPTRKADILAAIRDVRGVL